MAALKSRYNCLMLVDEAHATGVFGDRGAGRVSGEGVTGDVDFVMGTFSKALGGFGAYVATSAVAAQYLVNAARSFIYSTALPACVIAADLEAVRLCGEGSSRGAELLAKAARFREALARAGLERPRRKPDNPRGRRGEREGA